MNTDQRRKIGSTTILKVQPKAFKVLFDQRSSDVISVQKKDSPGVDFDVIRCDQIASAAKSSFKISPGIENQPINP